MIKIQNLLLEALTLYKVEVLAKTSADQNQVYIYNQIRGLKSIVVLTVEQSDFLRAKSNEKYQYELLKIKFLAEKEPTKAINDIKLDALVYNKIPGLIQFIPRLATVEKIGQY